MKLTIDREVLVAGVELAGKCSDPRGLKPILADIILEVAEDGRCRAAGTDLEVMAVSVFAAEKVSKPGRVCVSPERLGATLKAMREETVKLEVVSSSLVVTDATSRIRLLATEADDFPDLAAAPAEATACLPMAVLGGMISASAYAVSCESQRYAMNGCLLSLKNELHKDTITMEATDGRRVARAKRPLETPVGEAVSGIVAPRALKFAQSLEGENVHVTFNDRFVTFSTPSGLVRATLIEGRFPPIDEVLPESQPSSLVVGTEEFLRAVKAAAVVTAQDGTSDSSAVTLSLQADGPLTVTAESPEEGDARIEFEGKFTGEPLTILFFPPYLIQAVEHLGVDEATLGFTDKTRLCSMEAGGNLSALMPVCSQ